MDQMVFCFVRDFFQTVRGSESIESVPLPHCDFHKLGLRDRTNRANEDPSVSAIFAVPAAPRALQQHVCGAVGLPAAPRKAQAGADP
jgi:hypothetical protein